MFNIFPAKSHNWIVSAGKNSPSENVYFSEGIMGLFDFLFGSSSKSNSSSSSYGGSAASGNASVNLDTVRSLLNSRTSTLKNSTLTENNFYAGLGDPPEIREPFNLGLDAKRRGDLISANRYFCECFRKSETFHSPFIWSWCKIMILAKNWECLRDLLEYHFDMMVAWNRLMKKKGNQAFFDNYANLDMIPYFEFSDFHAGEALRDQVHSPLMERQETIARLSQYGGSPYWTTNFTISESEWCEFQRIFPLPNL